jgi:flagellar motor protein MotB
MYQLQQKQKQAQEVLLEYKNSKEALYKELDDKFKDRFQKWDMRVGEDLSIQFKNPDILFDYQSSELSPKFVDILNEFIPQYLEILNKEEYKDRISEIRIEGHTAYWNDYMYSINLSQQRANAVLNYIFQHPAYLNLNDNDKVRMRYLLTSNGLGFGRALDGDGELVYRTGGQISPLSRRVEFKIVTKSDELINKLNQ